jgi:hypothetical protein
MLVVTTITLCTLCNNPLSSVTNTLCNAPLLWLQTRCAILLLLRLQTRCAMLLYCGYKHVVQCPSSSVTSTLCNAPLLRLQARCAMRLYCGYKYNGKQQPGHSLAVIRVPISDFEGFATRQQGSRPFYLDMIMSNATRLSRHTFSAKEL